MYITKRSNPNGSLAVYETECKRVPEYPYPRQFKTCIGKEVAGEFIPNRFYLEREKKRKLESELELLKSDTKKLQQEQNAQHSALADLVGAKRKKAGATYLLDMLCLREGFTEDLEIVFGALQSKRILSLAYYMILTNGAALDDFTFFDRSHEHPFTATIASSTSSGLLASISEEQVLQFLKLQRQRNAGGGESGFFCFDSTTISTYAKNLSNAEISHGKQDPGMRHVAIALCYNDRIGRCVAYRIYRANVPDVKTIRLFIEQMRLLGYRHKRIVADRGYCSWLNIYQLYKAGFKVVMAMKANMKEFKQMRVSWAGRFEDAAHYDHAHQVYGVSELRTIRLEVDGEEVSLKAHMHLYLDPLRKAQHTTELLDDLALGLTSLNQVITDTRPKPEELEHDPLYRKYKKLLKIIHTRNNRFHLERDIKAIDERCAAFGYFEILTTEALSSTETLSVYRAKDGGEKVFKAVKTDLGFDRPNVASDRTLEGKVFVTMLGGMLVSMMRKTMAEHRKVFTRKLTFNKVIHELECINRFTLARGKQVWGEISDRQKKIFEAFDIDIPLVEQKVSAKVKKKRKKTQ
ncbi:MAG: transposase [Bacteroidetes bacterium]|nr:transposase [Bacteroidota bacterium]